MSEVGWRIKHYIKKVKQGLRDKLRNELFSYSREYENGLRERKSQCVRRSKKSNFLIANYHLLITKLKQVRERVKLHAKKIAIATTGGGPLSHLVGGTGKRVSRWMRRNGRKLTMAAIAVVVTLAMVVGFQPPVPTKATSNSVTWTTQGDFESNAVTTGDATTRSTYIDTTSVAGDVRLGEPTITANLILFWDDKDVNGNTISLPAGWEVISDQAGEPFYQRFPRGAEIYGGVGGTTDHTHTISLVSCSGPSPTKRMYDGSYLTATSTHTHSLSSSSVTSASHLPVYRNLKVIKYNDGVPITIPAGAVAVFDGTLPSGWTRYSSQDNYFVRGEGTIATGGANSHNHPMSFTTGVRVRLLVYQLAIPSR